jgi:alcohol-forming fatty acyl-CoA reductase
MDTSIAETFRDGTVFVTGGTGFLGKILADKLLRSCSLKKIAILVRSKKGVDSIQRVAEIYNQSVSLFFSWHNKLCAIILCL